jgi:SAM-dependent methyltransferase
VDGVYEPKPVDGLLDRWRTELATWAIPEEITARVNESPWELPRQMFVRRADRRTRAPSGPSFERAWEVLDPPGDVLDVGAGAGAACLPLASRATSITAVDADPQLLDSFAARAEEIEVPTRIVVGRWPDVAAEAPLADVVTCHHVLYNVPDLGSFISALTDHARRRVVVEVSADHPMADLNPLWEQFHGLRRPQGPTARDLLAILATLGLRPQHQEWHRPAEADFASFADLVDATRRRLCLPADRAADVASALHDRPAADRRVVTIWWTP